MVGIKINSPWVQEMNESARNSYENYTRVLNDAGVVTPTWDELDYEVQEDFRQLEYHQYSKVMNREMLDLRALSVSIFSPRWGDIYDVGETSTSFQLVFRHNSGVHAPFKTPVLKKVMLKPVSRVTIYWVKKDNVRDLRLEIVSSDYTKVKYEGLDEILDNRGLSFLYGVLQESAAYMRHFGENVPYF